MSVESLLLLALLIVLPLLEWLVRVLRVRRPQRPEEPALSPPHQPPPDIRSPVLMPPTLPPPRHRAAERPSAGERIRLSRMRQQAVPAEPMGGGNPPSRARHVFAFGHAADLRRAMMLVAILGPCKALEGAGGRES